jgi:uncharacterized membrane protein
LLLFLHGLIAPRLILDFKTMNYFEKARRRSRRRKSPWNLLLIPAVLIPLAALYLASLLAVEALHLLLLGSDQVNWLILWMNAQKRGPF